MPTVSVFQDSLQEALPNFDCSEESFDELCFEFGLELDEVTSAYEMALKETKNEKAAEGLSKRVIYKIDVPANRYDLLCVEGLVRALKIFKSVIQPPKYALSQPKPAPQMQMRVKAATAQIRPFVVAAVLRNVTFNQDRYQSFIDLQDKLHQNICRRRTLVAIGTHDLSTLKPPFVYDARPPKDIHFVPLGQTEKMDGNRMMEVLSNHLQLKAYLPIIRDSPVYPCIYDSNDVLLSLPPIINGEHSKIRLETKDVFIECTATDLTKAIVTLNTVCTMFAEYCEKPFLVEPVEVVYEKDYPGNTFVKPGDSILYPKIDSRPMECDIARMKKSLKFEHISDQDACNLIKRMGMPCEADKKGQMKIQVPVTRSDIMHECDVIEDMAIAYGYNNITPVVPKTICYASEQPVNHLIDLLRQELAMASFTECLNWALVSRHDNFTALRQQEKPEELWRYVARPHEYALSHVPVSISITNQKTREFEIGRTTILAGLLKTLSNNREAPLPLKLFEAGDIMIQDPTKEVGMRNARRIAALYCATRSNFALLHGVLDQVMYAANCEPEAEHAQAVARFEAGEGKRPTRHPFKLVPSDSPTFMPGMQASVVCEGVSIGIIGELHPEVLGDKGFGINLPTSAFELNVEPFLDYM